MRSKWFGPSTLTASEAYGSKLTSEILNPEPEKPKAVNLKA